MKKKLIASTITILLSSISISISANTLSTNDTLTIDAMGSEITGCVLGSVNPTTGDCQIDGVDNPALNITSTTGSYFMYGPGTVGISSLNGIIIGSTQLASGSHAGLVDGTESPNIDNPFVFGSNTGMHQSLSPITVISATELDFTGWSMTWNGIPSIFLGGCSQGDPADNGRFGGCDYNQDGVDDVFDTGIATISIIDGRYLLDYIATIPAGDASGTGGSTYTLRLEGSIIHAVPVPAAVWLFGSGLLGLIGLARRKHSY